MVRSALKPGNAEEHRREEGRDQAAQLLVDMAGQDRRFADQDAGDEGAEHGVHADQVGDRAPSSPMMTRMAVITANSLTKVSLTQRMMKNTTRRPIVRLDHHEDERADDALARAISASTVPCKRETEDDRRR